MGGTAPILPGAASGGRYKRGRVEDLVSTSLIAQAEPPPDYNQEKSYSRD